MTLSERIVAALTDVDPTLKAELEVGLEAMAVITNANLAGTELVAMEDSLIEYTELWATIGRALNPAFAGAAIGQLADAEEVVISEQDAEPVVEEEEEEEEIGEELEAEEPNSMQLSESGDDLFINED